MTGLNAQYTTTTPAFRLTDAPASGYSLAPTDPSSAGSRPQAAFLQATTNDIRWTVDGTAPTSAIGMLLVAGSNPLFYAGPLNQLRFIQVGAGSVLNVTYAGLGDGAIQGPPGPQGPAGPTGPTGGGTVTSVSVVAANGVSGSVATATSTPAITLALGAITPTTVNGNTISSGTTSGTNSGDQTSVSGNAGTATKLATSRTIGGVSFDGSANIAQPFDVMAFYPGVPTVSAVVVRVPIARVVGFVANFAGSYGIASVAATASTAFDIRQNGSSIGTATFAISATTATFVSSGGSAQSFLAGDVLSIVAPVSPDLTLANVGFVLAGTR